MAAIYLEDLSSGSPGTTYRLYGGSVSISNKRNVDSKPNANIDAPVEVQTLSTENNTITVGGINWIDDSLSITYAALLNLIKMKYNGANKVFLIIYLGTNNSTKFPDMNGDSTLGIPVILTGYTINMSSKETEGAYIPTINLTFVETA